MVNNSTNINKTNNHLSPQIIEHRKDHDILHWKSRSWLGVKPLDFQRRRFAISLNLGGGLVSVFMGIKFSLILWFNPSTDEQLMEVKHNILCYKHSDIFCLL